MSTKLYVGNLPIRTTDADLLELFGLYGVVATAGVVMDKNTNRSRGFAFVEMTEGAAAAVSATNGMSFQGRTMMVSEAQPRVVRPLILPAGRRA